MNCQMFIELANDIARDQMMDAAVRAEALAHGDDCVTCAAWLRSQQHLTADLRELVSATKDQTASPTVWEHLSVAFDARPVTQIKTNRWSRIYAAGAIAAMLILAFAVAGIVKYRQPIPPQALAAATFPPATPAETINEREPRDVSVSINQKPHLSPRRHSAMREAPAVPASQPKEIATDFILLTYDGEVGSDAQMVRVELPRSAMASFGLPVNVDRADQRVKADVLMGADGLARAIRFVQ